MVPLRKSAKPLAKTRGGLEAEIALQSRSVGVSHGNVARLHGHQLFVRFKIVILGKNARPHQLLLENIHKIEKILGRVVSYILNSVRRHGKPVLARYLFGRILHHVLHARHDIVNVSKIALAVAIVENFNGLSLAKLIRKTKIRHVGTSRRAVYRKEA